MQNLKLEFIKSVYSLSCCPEDSELEIVFIGRSNAGKSSLINALSGRKHLAKISKSPGQTKCLNYYKLDDKIYLVDVPGYGYAKSSKTNRRTWASLMKAYLAHVTKKLILVLMDCRHPMDEKDLTLINYALFYKINLYIILTKSDKLSKQKSTQVQKETIQYLKDNFSNIFIGCQLISTKNTKEITKLNQTLCYFIKNRDFS